MIVDEVENFQARSEVFRDIVEHLVVDLAAIQLKMFQIGVGPQKFEYHGFVHFREVILKHLG